MLGKIRCPDVFAGNSGNYSELGMKTRLRTYEINSAIVPVVPLTTKSAHVTPRKPLRNQVDVQDGIYTKAESDRSSASCEVELVSIFESKT
jgi:hypothetical protein